MCSMLCYRNTTLVVAREYPLCYLHIRRGVCHHEVAVLSHSAIASRFHFPANEVVHVKKCGRLLEHQKTDKCWE